MAVEENYSAAMCDQCGPAVKGKVVCALPSGGVLIWCYHCANVNTEAVRTLGGELYPLA